MNKVMPTACSRYQPLWFLLAAYLLLGLLLRITLYLAFGVAAPVRALDLLWVLPVGAAADAVQALYLLAPLALLLWLLPDGWQRSRWARGPLTMLVGLWMFSMLFVAASEYFFFEEFDARFNLVSVNYLMYPTEVAGDVWAEYPVLWIVAIAALLAVLGAWRWSAALRRATESETTLRRRTVPLAGFAAALGLTIAVVPASAFGLSTDRVTNELAANGIGSFFRALRTSEIDYHAYYATRDRQRNITHLETALQRGGQFTRLAEGRIDRRHQSRPDGRGRLNVVLIMSESFGAEFSRLYGAARDWTPEFDALAQQSLWFSRTYASGTRTVRGLEALSASIPPIPTESIVRRPGNDGVITLGEVLRSHGYSTMFMYGGYGYFDNMNAFYTANGYEVIDRTALTTEPRFENIWGVADEDLFDLALGQADTLAARGKPFLIQIMNTSNHKPFTFRAGLEQVGVKPEGGGRESGVRYADYAQGYFIREARKHTWFDDTVFIIVADHGARVYGRQDIPLKSYEIPLLFYSPKHLQPARNDLLMTQIDVAPTLMGLLGLPYTAPWFGQDALNTPAKGRVALFSHNDKVALLRQGELAILGLRGSIDNVRYDFARDGYTPATANPELNDLAIAYYQTAYELFTEHKLN